jgi:hypothetical protein
MVAMGAAFFVGLVTTAVVSGVRFGSRIAALETKMGILEGTIRDALERFETKFDKFLERCDRRHEE